MTKTNWSKYQNDIYDVALGTNDNIIIQACAGSGKSTTLFEAVRRLSAKHPDMMMMFMSFNKEIQQHAERKLKDVGNCRVFTFHGYGNYLIKSTPFSKKWKPELNVSKVYKYVFSNECDFNPKKKKHLFRMLTQFRMLGFLSYDVNEMCEFIDDNWADIFGFPNPGLLRLFQDQMPDIADMMQDLDSDKLIYDFDDMCRFPLIYELLTPKMLPDNRIPDVVFVDECQDLNEYQFLFIEALMQRGARVISCGDRWQAIYGFRGADMYSMDRLKTLTKAREMPLSITYRCPSRIIRYVKYRMPDTHQPIIEPFNDGGKVVKKDMTMEKDIYGLDRLLSSSTQMVVSPKNKHLMSIWISLFERGVQANLKGSKITSAISNLLKTFKGEDIPFDKVAAKCFSLTQVEDADDRAVDLANTCHEFITRLKFTSYEQAEDALKKIAENDKGIKLHTVHSAKGLESEKVWLIDDFFESDQMLNMEYVALTRPCAVLYLITHADWGPKKMSYKPGTFVPEGRAVERKVAKGVTVSSGVGTYHG